MKNETLQNVDIDAEIQSARNIKKIFLGLSAMWRRKANAVERRVKKFERYKNNPGLFRVE
jgi:hypothetical protein